ncbi:MAG: biopolymer transporter ExbD [Pseudomonadota bacterium]
MGMQIGSAEEDEDEVIASINTTPLVDVMLVLLIIFLITIPVVTHTVPVDLPTERNQPTQTKPENIIIAVDRDGNVFWNEKRVPDLPALFERMKTVAVKLPQPEIHIRGDQAVRYQSIGEVVVTCQRAGIAKISFITEPPAKG